MNLVILRCLEYGNSASLMTVLLNLIFKYRKLNCKTYLSVFGLLNKALLKIAAHLKRNLDIESIDFNEVFNGILLYLENFYKNIGFESIYYDYLEREDIGVKVLKTVVYSITKVIGKGIGKYIDGARQKGYKQLYLLER